MLLLLAALLWISLLLRCTDRALEPAQLGKSCVKQRPDNFIHFSPWEFDYLLPPSQLYHTFPQAYALKVLFLTSTAKVAVISPLHRNAMHLAGKTTCNLWKSSNQQTLSLWFSKSTEEHPNLCAVTIWGTISIHVWIRPHALFLISSPKLHYCCIRITNKLKTWSNRQLYPNHIYLVFPLAVFTVLLLWSAG